MGKVTSFSKVGDLAHYLEAGEQYTAKQIQTEFGIVNPTWAITYLRKHGYPIYSNKSAKGQKTVYRIGKPRREAIAQAYMILGVSMYK
jgi:hypothetical protein